MNSELKKETKHIPVLLKEVIEGLDLDSKSVVLDGTAGGGGYLKKICETVGSEGIVIGIDQDKDAIERVMEKLSKEECTFYLVNENFRNLDKVLEKLNIEKINAIVFDLGLSSDQFEISGRGFTFQKDEPLLMTFKKDLDESDLTAQEIVNTWDEENIADILFGYGGEKFSRRIAKNIVEARKEREIETTFELVKIIENSVPHGYKKGKIHPATKTFQALRITVNDEMGALKEALSKGFEALDEDGKMVVVSFHSDEDRIVKNFMRDRKKEKTGIVETKKPIIATREEVKENPRSRSAKLRVIKKMKNE